MNEARTLFLVRHAEPTKGYSGRYDLLPGPGLSQTGRHQARAAGRFLAEKDVRHIYHSPFQRAVETAALIATAVGRPSRAEPALQEWRRDETAEVVRGRLLAFLRPCLDQFAEPVALISHGGPIEQMLQFLSQGTLSLKNRPYWGRTATPLAGIWRGVETDGHWALTLVFQPAPVTSA